MKKLDCVFLGDGPTAISVMGHYLKKPNRENYLLLSEVAAPQGAIHKGVKTVNLIIPKLPNISRGNVAQSKYQFTIDTLRNAEVILEEIFGGFTTFKSEASVGYRVCRSIAELKVLQSLKQTGNLENDALALSAVEFVGDALGYRIEKDMLFSYTEKIWDVDTYLDFSTARIPQGMIVPVNSIELLADGDGVKLHVELDNGTMETILTKKVVVCKGTGNIEFEQTIRNQQQLSCPEMSFSVLPFSKVVYNGGVQMPTTISSIMLPDSGICVTNEQGAGHSLLYDTNKSPVPVNAFDLQAFNNSSQQTHLALRNLHNGLPTTCSHTMSCAMTVDLQAYTSDTSRHFKFIVSPSIIPNLHYLNLPYFSVLGTALQHLPSQIKDLK